MRKWYWRIVLVGLVLPWLQALLLRYSPDQTPQDWEHVKLAWTGALESHSMRQEERRWPATLLVTLCIKITP